MMIQIKNRLLKYSAMLGICWLIVSSITASAQERLTLDGAIAKALLHNFDIQIAQNNVAQTTTNNTLGNAGFLPTVQGNGFYNFSSMNVINQFSNGTTQERNGAISNNYGGSINTGITVFAAGKAYVIKKQLTQLQALSEDQWKLQIQTTISQVIQAYAQLVLQRQQIMAIDTALSLAKIRMTLSEMKYASGLSAKVDFLQARVDYNTRQSDSLRLVGTTQDMFADINYLMGEDPYKQYLIDDSLSFHQKIEPQQKEILLQNNLSVSIAQRDWEVARLGAKAAKLSLLPSLDWTAGYNYNKTQSQSGFALFNQSLGFTTGLALNIPIFQAGNLSRASKIASLQALQNEIRYEKQHTEIARQYRRAWSAYTISHSAYQLEQQNIAFAKENLDIQKARFRAGLATTIETREAENSYVTALVRLYNAAYNLKLSETRVLELDNKLVE